MLKQRIPLVEHLKIFDSIAYVLLRGGNRGKLREKCEKCIHVGYNEQSKAYRLHNPNTNQLVISINVTFNESAE